MSCVNVVRLVEGKMRFKEEENSTILKPGFSLTYKEDNIQIERFDADDLLSCRKVIFLINDKAPEDVFKLFPMFGPGGNRQPQSRKKQFKRLLDT